MTQARHALAAELRHPSGGSRTSRWALVALVAVLLAATALGFLSRGVTAPQGSDAPADAFSAERAAAAVAPVVTEPRPIGSVANDEAHDVLSGQLAGLGFAVETHAAIGTWQIPGYAAAGYTRNLIATRPGTDPTGTTVLATHIDSVPNAPGAADAGVGLAVILETVRALGPGAQRNDLVVLLVDGEEDGLLGADAYVRERAGELAQPVVVLNHEARGVSGRPVVTRTNGPMHEVLGSMPRPEYESFTDALFAIIPNDTDFTVYRDAGWWGMDMAIIDDSWAYHSPQDDAAHLDHGSLQHYGDLTLALTRDLVDRDLSALETHAGEQPVQTTAPWGIVQLAPLLITVLGVSTPVVLLGALVVRRRRGELTVAGTGVAAGASVIGLVLGAVAPMLLWQAAAEARPQMLSQAVGEPVRAGLFVAAELAAAATVAAVLWVLLRFVLGRAAITTGAALMATALLGVLAVWSPALGGGMVVPAAAAAIGALFAAALPRPTGLLVRALALLPTGWLLGTQLSALMEFGIASSSGGIAGTTLLALGAAAPLFVGRTGRDRSAASAAPARPVSRHAAAADTGRPMERRLHRLLIPAVPAVLAAGLTVAGTVHTVNSPEPVQESVTAHVDATTGETTWETSASTGWGARLDGASTTTALEGPTVDVSDLTAEGPGRVQLVLRSPRGAPRIDLMVTGGALADVTIDGLPGESTGRLRGARVVGVRPGQEVVLDATLDGDPEITVTDVSHDPSDAAGWVEPPDDVSLVQPSVRVSSAPRAL